MEAGDQAGVEEPIDYVGPTRLRGRLPNSAIETWNAGTNAHMLAINHAMGFRAEAEQELVQGDLAALLARLRARG